MKLNFLKRASRAGLVAGISTILLALGALAGSLTPPGAVSSTMHSLAELYDSIVGSFDSSAIVANQNGSLIENLKYVEANLAWASSSNNIWNLNSGNVGIGTTTPLAKVDINAGTTEALRLTTDSQNPYALMINNLTVGNTDGTGFGFWQGDDGTGHIDNQGFFSLTFGTGGNVGIVNASISDNLEVAGTASISGVLYANGGCVGCGGGGSGVASNSLDFDEFVDAMTLDANTTIASAGHTLTINGNVGIGTTPQGLLTLNDHLHAQGAISVPFNPVLTYSKTYTSFGQAITGQSIWNFPAGGGGLSNAEFVAQTASASAQNMTGTIAGLRGRGEHIGTGVASIVVGVSAITNNWSAGTISDARSVEANVSTMGAGGTITNASAVFARAGVSGGKMTNMFNFYAARWATTGGTVFKQAGMAIEHMTQAANNTELLIASTSAGLNIPAGNWGIYDASPYTNYFASNVGIATTTPTAQLSILTNQTTARAFDVSSASAFGPYFKIASSGLSTMDGAAIAPKFSAKSQGPVPGTTLEFARSVFVQGKYLYIAANSTLSSLVIYDISNPASPSYVSKTQSPTFLNGVTSVVVVGEYAYLAALGRNSLAVVDISNPASPSFVAETRGPVPGTSLQGAQTLFVKGKYAYVSCFLRDSLAVIDISDPLHPTYITETRGPIPGTSLDTSRHVFVSGNYAYTTQSTPDTLAVIDISNPASPSFVASTGGPVPGTSLDSAGGLSVVGKYAYIAVLGRSSLAVVDISDPANPTFVAETQGPVPGTSLNTPTEIFVSGRYAYMSLALRDAVAVIDISNPLNPTYVGETRGPVPGTTLDNPQGLFVSGRYAYVALNAGHGIAAIDVGGLSVSNMTTGALEVGNLNVGSYANFAQGLFVQGGLGVGGTALLQSGISVGDASVSSNFAGKVGIGTITPVHLLHVASSGNGAVLRLQDSDGTCDHNPGAATEVVTCTSDQRLKSNITDAPSVLGYLDSFHIRQYTVNASGIITTGVIAQEVLLSHPDLVTTGSDGMLMVQEPNPWLLVKAIQELNIKIGSSSASGPAKLDTGSWLPGDFSQLFAMIVKGFKNYLGIDFSNDTIETHEVRADKLCVGDVCVTREQFLKMVHSHE